MEKTKTKAFADLIGAIVFIIAGIWAWAQTTGFKYIKNTEVQPSAFPRIMIVGMEIFAIVLLIQSIVRLAKMDKNDPSAQPMESLNPVKHKEVWGALAVIALCIFFVACFNSLGYVIVSFIVSFVIMIIIGKREWGKMALISFLVPLVMFVLFYKVLQVNIPMGPLTFIRSLLDLF